MKLFTLMALLVSTAAFAQDTNGALKALRAGAESKGAPKLDGKDLYFGKTKINGNFETVDAVKKQFGGVATIFAKDGAEYIRVSTNVMKDDGTRAVGTQLAHNKAFEALNKGNSYCGDADILGKKYDTCYEPIKVGDKVVGAFLVGFPQ